MHCCPLAPHLPSPCTPPWLQADGDYPGADHFRYKLSLDRPGSAYNLSLCPSQVRGANWTLAVYNPMPTVPIGYNVTVHRIGRCLHACSGHGT